MKVLSLFDGISCGRIALERAGIPVGKYYASEVDKYAEKISEANYPDIVRLGDVTKWREWDIEQPDLICAGSPCQGFSFAGKQLNFSDPRSSLFFEFVNILNHYKPKYFLLENVKMKKEYQDTISQIIGVKPIKINSSLLSAQNRERLYWTNIASVAQPEDKGIVLKDIVSSGSRYEFLDRVKTDNGIYKKGYYQYDINGKGHGSQDQRAYYLNGKHGCLVSTGTYGKSKILMEDGSVRYTSRNESERLQTVPDNYTSPVAERQAKSALGNGWTVDVIAHIFKNIE